MTATDSQRGTTGGDRPAPSLRAYVTLLPLIAGCASLIGLEDAAGELDDGASSTTDASSTSTATGASSAGGATSSTGGDGGGATSTTTVSSGGGGAGDGGAGGDGQGGSGGAPGPVAFDVALLAGSGAFVDLQASSSGAVLLGVDGVTEAGSFGDCSWESPLDRARDRSALALRVDPADGCTIVDRLDVVGTRLDVRSVGASFAGAYLGLGGRLQGVLHRSDPELLSANGDALFAATSLPALPIVGINDPGPLNDGDGEGFVGGRGPLPTFFGHFEGDVRVAVLTPKGEHCAVMGAEGVVQIAAFPVHVDCAPPPASLGVPGRVLDVASSSQRLGAAFRRASDGHLAVGIMSEDADEAALVDLLAIPELAPVRLAVGATDLLVAGSIADDVAAGPCGGSQTVTGPSAFGARVGGAFPTPGCGDLWVDGRFDRAIPIGQLVEGPVYLVHRSVPDPDQRGWWIARASGDQLVEGRRFCGACSVIDASLSGAFAYVTGLAASADVVGGVSTDEDAPFLARIARVDLLTGSEPLPAEPR